MSAQNMNGRQSWTMEQYRKLAATKKVADCNIKFVEAKVPGKTTKEIKE